MSVTQFSPPTPEQLREYHDAFDYIDSQKKYNKENIGIFLTHLESANIDDLLSQLPRKHPYFEWQEIEKVFKDWLWTIQYIQRVSFRGVPKEVRVIHYERFILEPLWWMEGEDCYYKSRYSVECAAIRYWVVKMLLKLYEGWYVKFNESTKTITPNIRS